MIGVVEADVEERRLFLGMPAHFGQFIGAVGRSVLLSSLDLAFSLIALFLLPHLFFLTFVKR